MRGRTRRPRRAAPGRTNRRAAPAPGTAAAWPGTPRPRPAPRPSSGDLDDEGERAEREQQPAAASVAMPHGSEQVAPAARGTRVSRIAEASSTSARSGPAYSSTIASCTIVSSRWVDGLSTGSRPVSATITTTSATAASRLAGENTCAGRRRVEVDDRGQVGRPDRHRQREDRHQQGRLDQGDDRDLPAGAHPAERGAGVEPGQRQRDRAQRQQRDHREQVGDRVQQRTRWSRTGRPRPPPAQVATSSSGRRPEHLAGAARGDRLLAHQLAQVPPRLPDARLRRGPPSGPGSAASPRSAAVTAHHDQHDLQEHADHAERRVTGSPPAGSAAPHSDAEAVAEVAVHAAVGQPRPGPAPRRAPRRAPGRYSRCSIRSGTRRR